MSRATSGHVFLASIGNFCEDHPLGWVLGADCGYQCYPDWPKLVRKPDVSFIRLGRLPIEKPPEGHCPIPPDLAVEVLSPRDLIYEVSQKVEEYLGAGVRLVWVLDPKAQTILIYRADGSIEGLRANDELDGEDVIPGFRCRVGTLFVMPAGAWDGTLLHITPIGRSLPTDWVNNRRTPHDGT